MHVSTSYHSATALLVIAVSWKALNLVLPLRLMLSFARCNHASRNWPIPNITQKRLLVVKVCNHGKYNCIFQASISEQLTPFQKFQVLVEVSCAKTCMRCTTGTLFKLGRMFDHLKSICLLKNLFLNGSDCIGYWYTGSTYVIHFQVNKRND